MDCEAVADLVCESEATKLKADEDKRQCKAEESLGWAHRATLETTVVLLSIPIPRVGQRFPACSTVPGQGGLIWPLR